MILPLSSHVFLNFSFLNSQNMQMICFLLHMNFRIQPLWDRKFPLEITTVVFIAAFVQKMYAFEKMQ